MLNSCLHCGKAVKNKYCNTSCQNSFQNKQRTLKRINYYSDCKCCGKEFLQVLKENGKDYKRVHCSKKCSNHVRVHSEETKQKISQKSKGHISLYKKIYTCRVCSNVTIRHRKTCSDECLKKILHSTAVKRSISKRSKNESLFAELCINYFKNVETNKSIFNGWDADVIIHDIKTAILWNGVWHYKKITKLHSVEQVQNRDKIKIKEIQNYGYRVYIIKDLGKYKKEFVEEKFKEFVCSLLHDKAG